MGGRASERGRAGYRTAPWGLPLAWAWGARGRAARGYRALIRQLGSGAGTAATDVHARMRPQRSSMLYFGDPPIAGVLCTSDPHADLTYPCRLGRPPQGEHSTLCSRARRAEGRAGHRGSRRMLCMGTWVSEWPDEQQSRRLSPSTSNPKLASPAALTSHQRAGGDANPLSSVSGKWLRRCGLETPG